MQMMAMKETARELKHVPDRVYLYRRMIYMHMLVLSESGQTTFCYVGMKNLGFKARKGSEHFERLISWRLLTLSQSPENER